MRKEIFEHWGCSWLDEEVLREPTTMNRRVLAIPKDEVESHFAENERQDLKVIAPEMLSEAHYESLKEKVKGLKMEALLDGIVWRHSARDDRNRVCAAAEFKEGGWADDPAGPFAISFANERAAQDEHYHERHLEIYVSDYRLSAEYGEVEEAERRWIDLPKGGVLIFAAGVVHKVRFAGFTVVIELPAVVRDKKLARGGRPSV